MTASTDQCPMIPRRVADDGVAKEDRGEGIFQTSKPARAESSSSLLAFMVSPVGSASSRLVPEKDHRHVQRCKSSSVLEVVMFQNTRGAAPLKTSVSYSEGSSRLQQSRRGNLTLSNRTNSLKRAGTSRTASRQRSDLSQSSLASTASALYRSVSLEEEEDNDAFK